MAGSSSRSGWQASLRTTISLVGIVSADAPASTRIRSGSAWDSAAPSVTRLPVVVLPKNPSSAVAAPVSIQTRGPPAPAPSSTGMPLAAWTSSGVGRTLRSAAA